MDSRTLLTAALLIAAMAGATAAARGSQRLKCRTEEDDQNEFREVARRCMGNASNWDRPSDDRGSGRRSGLGRGGQSDPGKYGAQGYNNRDSYDYQSTRNYNYGNNNRNGYQSRTGSRNRQDNYNRNNKNNRDPQSSESDEYTDLEDIEPCIVHCIFRQMQMLDDESFPERTSVTNIMMRNVKDSKVKDFVDQAIDECFEMIESDNRSNKCESAKNLAMCLEDKGRQNCEDWDDPPEPKNQRGNTKSNSRSQQRDASGYM